MNDVTDQILKGNESIIGIMLESFINAGNQSIPEDLGNLEYGVSVTDACIDWETTERSLVEMAEKLKGILPNR